VTWAEEFGELRPLLFAIAYRILGSASEAEAAVQDTWLRYEGFATQPKSTVERIGSGRTLCAPGDRSGTGQDHG
jgi:hypothetical protein